MQPQADATAAAHASAVGAVEGLGQVRQLLGRDAGAVVAQAERDQRAGRIRRATGFAAQEQFGRLRRVGRVAARVFDQVAQQQAQACGVGLHHGDAGSGKSVVMRLLAERLARLSDLSVGVIHHPQSNLSDFYRELGDIFGISMRMSNRWGGFKALRARWLDHLDSASRRPVILIDEAQEMTPMVLSELRLLASARFDSQSLLCVVLSGDARLLDKLRREELIPLGSRIRTRLATGVATREELLACLEHLLATAGNASLMTKQLRNTLCDHAAGNYRIFIGMAAELLMTAAQREITELDEKLYLQVFAQPETQTTRRAGAR